MAARRGNTSWKSIAEDADIMVAYAYGEVSTGRACQVLGLDIITLRQRLNEAVRRGTERANVPCEVDARFETITVDAGMGG